MGKIPSLGDIEQKNLRLVKNVVEMPRAGRPALIRALEDIVGKGQVQKILVEVGQPILYWRLEDKLAEGDLPEVPEEILDEDLYSAARASPIEDFPNTNKGAPLSYLMLAFHELTNRRSRAKAFLVSDREGLLGWVESPDSKELFGIPIHLHGDIPEEVILLVASEVGDEEKISLSLRLEATVHREKA